MSCCGERRANLKARMQAQQQLQQRLLAQQGAAGAALPPVPTRLCYRSGIAVVVSGPITGQAYNFGAGRAPLEVDAEDAQALLDTGRFDPV